MDVILVIVKIKILNFIQNYNILYNIIIKMTWYEFSMKLLLVTLIFIIIKELFGTNFLGGGKKNKRRRL